MDSSTVDPGVAGVLGIVGDSADAEVAPPTSADDAAQDYDTAADTDAPETEASDLSAEEVVAARLAAALEDSGIEVPDPTDTDADPPDTGDHPLLTEAAGDVSLDSLTPEQLRALAEEAIRLRGEVSTATQTEGARKVAQAEAAAVAQVQAAFEQNVLAVAASHYTAVYRDRLAALANEVTQDELPGRAAALAEQVYQARQEWENQQYADYEKAADQARINARLAAPEFREYAATHLVKQAGLPEAAVAEVLKTTDTRQFEARVAELVSIRDALLAERRKNQAGLREEGRKRLATTTPRTASTGRPPGGKPPAYKGVVEEVAAIVRS